MSRLRIVSAAVVAALIPLAEAQQPAKPQNHGLEYFEAGFLASDVFRSGSLVFPVYRRLLFEGHYFGGEGTDAGYTGASWAFSLKELKIAPGLGVMFGSNDFATTPAVSFRWEYERKWFVTQGFVVQCFRETPIFEESGAGEHGSSSREPVSFVRPTITDINHASFRWRRLTVGPAWEQVAFREGREWKVGGRVGVRLLPRVSAGLAVFGPGGAEWRGGFLIHAP
jgi:hypothetical protein